MYQFYYADTSMPLHREACKENVREKFNIETIRPTMWEEHCLECSAPLCFENCLHYKARSDGRCKRFKNGLYAFTDEKACCGQGVRVKFRKWANMMTIVFPAMLTESEYCILKEKNQKLGNLLKGINKSRLPQFIRWQGIRVPEYIRRRRLRNLSGTHNVPDAFVFHGYSYHEQSFQLIMEIYDEHTSVYKMALTIQPGENLYIRNANELSEGCWKPGNLVKIYPENDLEVEMDILWCDFIRGTLIAKEVPATTVKCVVWDLDNTVWDGTFIETDTPEVLQIKEGVMETIRALDERGIIQSVASKNDYEAVYPILKRLGLSDYLLYPQIHWNAKSGSIEQIAKNLNIGIDSLALIDDSAFERNQVISVFPQVRTYDAEEVMSLLDYPEFQVVVTEESKKRRRMYQAEEKRNQLLQTDNGDLKAFIKNSHLQIRIFEPQSEVEKLRCYELVVRTNQLNMSGKKYTPQDFEVVLHRERHTNFAFSCKDDFGDYGIVGFGQYRIENKKMIFTEFAMSCRVAGKYVESALFTRLLQYENCVEGDFTVFKTKKNILLRNTLEAIGFSCNEDKGELINYVFTEQLYCSELVNAEVI